MEQPKRKNDSCLFSIIMMVVIVLVVFISGNHTERGTSNSYVSAFENENPNEKI